MRSHIFFNAGPSVYVSSSCKCGGVALLQVAQNVTTNELSNWSRYAYMRDDKGRYSNPFDNGIRRNCIEAFNPAASTADLPFALAGNPSETMSLLRNEQQSCKSAVPEGLRKTTSNAQSYSPV